MPDPDKQPLPKKMQANAERLKRGEPLYATASQASSSTKRKGGDKNGKRR